jgi:serine/threonine-protein kinase
MQTIGRYQIQSELGRGGMATVYRAYDPHFERHVALKVLPPGFLHDPLFRARFQREAKAIAALEHPAIVPVYDYGEEKGQLYLVMRLMSGGSLVERIAGRPLTVSETAEILSRLAPALDAAHQRGLVHRDLKPANILFDEWNQPYLSDFGIVKLVEDRETALTATGGLVGTPAYMSPEQVQADEELDGRSDIYALGVITYEMLTGELPYKANTPMGLALKHVTDPVPRILDKKGDLPEQVQGVIQRAMAKSRNGRYRTAAELAQALQAAAANDHPPGRPFQSQPLQQKLILAAPDEATMQLPQETYRPIDQPPVLSPPRSRRLPVGLAFLSGMFVFVLCSGVVLYSYFQGGGFLSAPEQEVAQGGEPAAVATQTTAALLTAPSTGAAAAPLASPSPDIELTVVFEVAAAEEIIITSQLGLEIIERGSVTIGWRGDDTWPFTIIGEDGSAGGFEVDLAEEIVGRLFGEDFPIDWQPASAVDRFPILQSGQVDMLVRTTTHTISREDIAIWGVNYFLDGQRFMVRQNATFETISDLDGHTICVQAGTITEGNLSDYFAENGWEYSAVVYLTSREVWDGFVNGECAALTLDWSLIFLFGGPNSANRVIGPLISSEPFAVGLAFGSEDFRDEVDAVLIEIVQDGTWEEIYNQWFPEPPPWTLEEMLNEPPPDR